MSRLSKEQKFLYIRIAILLAGVGCIGFAFAGFKGFSFWYGGFVLCLWTVLGLLNLRERSSVWFMFRRPALFWLFYGVLVAYAFLADELGLRLFLWVYPYYHGLGFMWVYFVLYPFGGLALLELLYFLSGHLGEPLTFKALPCSRWHEIVDVLESVLFIVMTGVIVLGAMGLETKVLVIAATSLFWMIFALLKLKLHIRHPGHYILLLLITTSFTTLLYQLPNALAREWVYLPAFVLDPLWSQTLFSIPFWVWVGYFWFTVVPLRLWIFLVLNPRVK